MAEKNDNRETWMTPSDRSWRAFFRVFGIACAVATSCLCTTTALALPILFQGAVGDRAAWFASVGANVLYTEDFQVVPDSWQVANNTTFGRNGITYNRITGSLVVTGGQDYGNFGAGVSYNGGPAGHVPIGVGVLTEGGEEHFEILFDTPARVVAMDVLLNGRTDTRVNPAVIPYVKFFNGSMLLGTATWSAENDVRFLGFMGDLAVTRIEFFTYAGSQTNTGIDNLAMGALDASVPEPSTLALLALGLAGLGLSRRRQV